MNLQKNRETYKIENTLSGVFDESTVSAFSFEVADFYSQFVSKLSIDKNFVWLWCSKFQTWFIKREKINNDELLNTNERSVDPYDLHVSQCGKNSLKKIQKYKIHSYYD